METNLPAGHQQVEVTTGETERPIIQNLTQMHQHLAPFSPPMHIPVLHKFPVHYDGPVGGRLHHFHERWQAIGADQWVLNLLREGHRPELQSVPSLSTSPHQFEIHNNVLEVMEHVQIMLDKEVIEPVRDMYSPGFYSNIFLVPKKSGGTRPVFNLKALNQYLVVPHFKMETVGSIMAALSPGDWVTSIDMTDGYFHVPIHPQFRKYLRFCIQGKVYQFRALPFGLATAPWVFTRLVKTVAAYLHSLGVDVRVYLDDWLFRDRLKRLLARNTRAGVDLAVFLGWVINWGKSDLDPTQKCVYVGVRYDLERGLCFPPEDRIARIREVILAFLLESTAKMCQRVLGLLTSAEKQVPWGRTHMRPLQLLLNQQWNATTGLPTQELTLSSVVRQDLQWWLESDNLRVGMDINKQGSTKAQ